MAGKRSTPEQIIMKLREAAEPVLLRKILRVGGFRNRFETVSFGTSRTE